MPIIVETPLGAEMLELNNAVSNLNAAVAALQAKFSGGIVLLADVQAAAVQIEAAASAIAAIAA